MQANKGYWRVGQELFDNKILAILAAQKLNLGPEDITWHYNDDAWDKFDWSQEPPGELADYYLQRAKDLRSRYKTLILRFSGGADSTNILKTCVDNDIKIDVIAVNEYYHAWNVPRTEHLGSLEKVHLVDPYLELLEKQGYEFQKMYLDTTMFFDIVTDPDWIFKVNSPRFKIVDIQAPRTALHPNLAQYNNPDTCIISGIDKPGIWCMHDKIWYFSIPDIYSCMCDPSISDMVQEPFYWTADMPELLIKQSHAVKNYMRTKLDNFPISVNHRFINGKQWLVPVLYPKYFQFEPGTPLPYYAVPTNPRYAVNDDVCDHFYENNQPIFDGHQQGVNLADNIIDRRFKKSDSIREQGLIEYWSKQRWLGK